MGDKLVVDYFQSASPALSGQFSRTKEGQRRFGKIKTFFGAFHTPIGLEFEIEGFNFPVPSTPLRLMYSIPKDSRRTAIYWRYVKDGSLRNNGVEFVSAPLSGHGIDYALAELEEFLSLPRNKSIESSVRTSIHVHVDVSEWKIKNIVHLPAFYALFENVLFTLHSVTRQDNPYCYKVQELRPYDMGIYPETKYCALNLAPIEKQLTVEFRHADYSPDMVKNRRWIQVVCKLMRYALIHQDELKNIVENTITRDGYLHLFNLVMGKSTVLFDMSKVEAQMKAAAPWAVATLEVT